MIVDQLTQAITLFGLGMGTVFVLLSILIFCVSVLSWLCKKIDTNQPTPSHQSPDTAAAEIDAVKSAVKSHRQAMGL